MLAQDGSLGSRVSTVVGAQLMRQVHLLVALWPPPRRRAPPGCTTGTPQTPHPPLSPAAAAPAVCRRLCCDDCDRHRGGLRTGRTCCMAGPDLQQANRAPSARAQPPHARTRPRPRRRPPAAQPPVRAAGASSESGCGSTACGAGDSPHHPADSATCPAGFSLGPRIVCRQIPSGMPG